MDIYDLLPEGYVAIDFALSVKALDENGDVCLLNSRSTGLSSWEALGMLISAADDLRATLREPAGEED